MFAGLFALLKVEGQTFTFSTLAGNAGYGSVDGTGSAARFNYPQGVAADAAGNVYVADAQNCTIRKITSAGVVTTIAGLAGNPGAVDGTNGGARFAFPAGVAVDGSGNVYVADTANHIIRKLTPAGSDWVVSTIAGMAGASGITDGVGTNAQFNLPGGLAVDGAGNVFVADTYNDTIRKVTLAGTNWMVSTIAGAAGVPGFINDKNTNAQFSLPAGITVDASNNLWVADTDNSAIRRVTLSGTNWVVSTPASVNLPGGISTDGTNNLYVSDPADNTILKVTFAGVVNNLAGTNGVFGTVDGTNPVARFNFPQGTAVARGNVYVADSLNNTIRVIGPTNFTSTLAGLAGGAGNANGTNSRARFSGPVGVTTDGAGNVLVADTGNQTIRLITAGGAVSTIAGAAGSLGSEDGTNGAAQFNMPKGLIAGGPGVFYVADSGNNEIRKVVQSGSNWVVSTYAGRVGTFFSGNITNKATFTGVSGGVTNILNFTNVSFVLTNASLFTNYSGVISNVSGGVTNFVFLVTNVPVVTNIVGGVPKAQQLGTNVFFLTNPVHSLDGDASLALFWQPSALAFDGAGDLYVADRANSSIRVITPGGQVSTFAGMTGVNGLINANGTNAQFYHPLALVFDGTGNLLVADTENGVVRKITPGGDVTTAASLGEFGSPSGLVVDGFGNMYVCDAVNHVIEKIKPTPTNAQVSVIGGVSGISGSTDGNGANALFNGPEGLALDGAGNLYVADTGNNTIRFGLLVPVPQPTLQITWQGNRVVLSWPLSATGFALEKSGVPKAGAAWSAVNGISSVGGNYVYTNDTSGTAAFFRLHLP